MKKILSKISFRFIVQLSILTTVVLLSLTHLILWIEKAASICGYCPFGAIESFFTLVFKWEFLKRIYTSSFILLGVFLLATLILGRVFCGYFCPLWAIQEWIRYIGKKIGFKKELELPNKIDKYLRYLKYFVLLIIIYYSFYLGDLIFRNYDPYNALMHFGREFDEKPIGYTILFLIITISLFSKSFWCRYLCPLGAFFGVVKKFSFFKIQRDHNTCNNCALCNKNCPANLDIKNQNIIKDVDCISCGNCIGTCPKNSLNYSIFNKQISKTNYWIIVIILVILPLAILPFTPYWKTKPESNIINIKWEINTNDIRWSNTLQYLIETTKAPFSEFKNKLNIPDDINKSTKLKDIGTKYNIKNTQWNILSTEDFRIIVKEYLKYWNNNKFIECPFGENNCAFPWNCGDYIDNNYDKKCDRSK